MKDETNSYPDVYDCNRLLGLLIKHCHCNLARQLYDGMLKRDV